MCLFHIFIECRYVRSSQSKLQLSVVSSSEKIAFGKRIIGNGAFNLIGFFLKDNELIVVTTSFCLKNNKTTKIPLALRNPFSKMKSKSGIPTLKPTMTLCHSISFSPSACIAAKLFWHNTHPKTKKKKKRRHRRQNFFFFS